MANEPKNPFLDQTQVAAEAANRTDETATSFPKATRPSFDSQTKEGVSLSEPSEKIIGKPKQKVWQIVGAVLTLFVITLLIWWWFRGTPPTKTSSPSTSPANTSAPKTGDAPSTTESLPIPSQLESGYKSENFKAGEIVIGGELQFLQAEDESLPLSIENIRGEAFTEKGKQDVKLVVTWTTNKLSQATIRYSKGIGQAERSLQESDYSFNHSLIISGLDPASTYLYAIDASDRFGNIVRSEPYAVFTGARTVSLFDLIAGALGDVFGWAVSGK